MKLTVTPHACFGDVFFQICEERRIILRFVSCAGILCRGSCFFKDPGLPFPLLRYMCIANNAIEKQGSC